MVEGAVCVSGGLGDVRLGGERRGSMGLGMGNDDGEVQFLVSSRLEVDWDVAIGQVLRGWPGSELRGVCAGTGWLRVAQAGQRWCRCVIRTEGEVYMMQV